MKKNKILITMIILITAIIGIRTESSAANYSYLGWDIGDGIVYEYRDEIDGYAIVDTYPDLEEVVIPDKYLGKRVLQMDYSVFQNNHNLKKITFNKYISEVNFNTFQNCVSLEEVVFNGNIKSIDQEAFSGCTALEKVTAKGSIDLIRWHAFYGCSALEKVTCKSIKVIGTAAFYGCSALEKVTCKNIKSVGAGAFEGCEKLTEIPSVKTIQSYGEGAFEGCKSLTKVTFKKGARIGKTAFQDCENLEYVKINTPAKYMENCGISGFSGTKWLQKHINKKKNLVMNGVLLYGGALKGDAVLSGKKYKMIAGKALQDNKNITSLTIKNVHYIAENILGNCTVKNITLIQTKKKYSTNYIRFIGWGNHIKKLTLDVNSEVIRYPGECDVLILGKHIDTVVYDTTPIMLKILKFQTKKIVEFYPNKVDFPNEKSYIFKGEKNLRHIYFKAKKPSPTIKQQFSKKVTLHVPKESKKIYKKYAKCKVVAR